MLEINFIVIIISAIIGVNFANFSDYFSWSSKIPSINEEMELIYKSRILPIEESYFSQEFHKNHLEDGYFDAKPTIVFIGQYSTGTVE
jgi:hypothetical protein